MCCPDKGINTVTDEDKHGTDEGRHSAGEGNYSTDEVKQSTDEGKHSTVLPRRRYKDSN